MRAGVFAAACCFALTAGADEGELLVFAAASTADAVAEVSRAFEAEKPGVKVTATFAGTSELVRQLQAGAKGDVFLSADEESLGRLKTRERVALLSNTLVVVVPDSSKLLKLSPAELPGLQRVAIADPLTVPAGKYAKHWLERQKLWVALEKKLVPALDVRAALAAVEAGRVQAAIVYATDAARSKKVREVHRVEGPDAPPIAYALALISGSSQSAALYAFMKGPQAAAIFQRHGFIVK